MRVPGVILAGGQGRRMGGGKPFVALADQPLIAHVVERLAPQCGVMAVNTNLEERELLAHDIQLPSLADPFDLQGVGPLVGVLTAMDWAAEVGFDRVVTAPVDTPFLPRDLVDRLLLAEAPIALAETEDGQHGTCGLWSVSLRHSLRRALRDGVRKVTDWTQSQNAVGVWFPETFPPPFFNVNRPDDLQRAEAYLRGEAP